jgi:hypothetical protein
MEEALQYGERGLEWVVGKHNFLFSCYSLLCQVEADDVLFNKGRTTSSSPSSIYCFLTL